MTQLEARPVSDATPTVSCPHCEKNRPASPGLYVCGDCGGTFRVEEVGQ